MKNKPRRFALYLLLRLGMFLIRALPRKVALSLAKVLGILAFYLVRKQRRKVLDHLRFAWKDKLEEKSIRLIGRRVFQNLAMMAVDVIFFHTLSQENLREWVSYEDEFMRINEILDKGKGAIILTGHIGNWELLAAAFGLMGYGAAVVGRRLYYEPYNQIIVKLRETVHMRTIYRDSSPREILKVLKSNQLLGMLADQDIDSLEGVFVDFFGVPSYTPTAPVKLAMAAKTVIVPAFMIREGKRYRLILEGPIYPELIHNSTEETVREFTERWSAVVEKYIRKYPDQWVWMHDRWKTRPLDESHKASLANANAL